MSRNTLTLNRKCDGLGSVVTLHVAGPAGVVTSLEASYPLKQKTLVRDQQHPCLASRLFLFVHLHLLNTQSKFPSDLWHKAERRKPSALQSFPPKTAF